MRVFFRFGAPARRGLLLPQRLPQVIPLVEQAMLYDELRGNYSVGSAVRDAACYLCWAFARAYDPALLQPYVAQLAKALIIMTVFDREVLNIGVVFLFHLLFLRLGKTKVVPHGS